MSRVWIGLDTSCYTTSVAAVDGDGIVFDRRTMLFVHPGERGLRQSEGVFQHTRNLPALTEALFGFLKGSEVAGVAVSAAPTGAEGSYMPVFLAGVSAASAAAAALGAPLIQTNHQAGHIRAALYRNEALLDKPGFTALHLSGGTTDLLHVDMAEGHIQQIRRIGGSSDLHAGQFVDRVGVRLGLSFPCGKALEQLALGAQMKDVRIPASVQDGVCSLSGAESAAQRLIETGHAPQEVAYAVYDCLARTIARLLNHVGTEDALLCGGVASSALLRELLSLRCRQTLHFALPELSSDNACGVALIGRDAAEAGQ